MSKYIVVVVMETNASFVWGGFADDPRHAEGLAISAAMESFYETQVQETISIVECDYYKFSFE